MYGQLSILTTDVLSLMEWFSAALMNVILSILMMTRFDGMSISYFLISRDVRTPEISGIPEIC